MNPKQLLTKLFSTVKNIMFAIIYEGEPTAEEEAAAINIQRVARGFIIRKETRKMSAAVEADETLQCASEMFLKHEAEAIKESAAAKEIITPTEAKKLAEAAAEAKRLAEVAEKAAAITRRLGAEILEIEEESSKLAAIAVRQIEAAERAVAVAREAAVQAAVVAEKADHELLRVLLKRVALRRGLEEIQETEEKRRVELQKEEAEALATLKQVALPKKEAGEAGEEAPGVVAAKAAVVVPETEAVVALQSEAIRAAANRVAANRLAAKRLAAKRLAAEKANKLKAPEITLQGASSTNSSALFFSKGSLMVPTSSVAAESKKVSFSYCEFVDNRLSVSL